MKFKTEEAAWLWLAGKWNKAKLSKRTFVNVRIGNSERKGVCLYSDYPTFGILDKQMYLRCKSNRPRNAGFSPFVYWWPATLAVAKKWAAFCRKLARQCKKEGV